MSEQLTGAEGGPSAGALLRQAREAAGLHVSTLAANLKVPVRKLEALEEDRYDLLPDAVFARALASSVCRTLRIDPLPVLQRLPQTVHPRLAQDRDGINTPFRPTSDAPRGRWLEQVSRPVAFIVAALLLAALGLVFWPEARDGDAPAALAGAESAMPPETVGGVTSAPAEPPNDGSVGDAASAAGQPASGPVVATATAVPALATASAAVAAAPAASAASAPVAGSGVVVFRATGSSWIQVTDARGTPVLRRLLEAGETATADGAPPLAVTVGNAQATEVQVRGQPYNLATVSRDNVARFEVK